MNANQRPRILAVDDEESICYLLRVNLELQGFEVDTALSAEEALRMKLDSYDLLLLDVMLPRMSGFEMAQQIRKDDRLRGIPIIFCTARDTEADLLAGFARGADDYIKKPFSMRELVARVKSVLHRSGRYTEGSVLTFKSLTLNAATGRCQAGGHEVTLTKTEQDLLALLLGHPGRTFSREEIMDRVWGRDVVVTDRTIDVNVSRLRHKLGQYGNNITTKLGKGYAFTTTD